MFVFMQSREQEQQIIFDSLASKRFFLPTYFYLLPNKSISTYQFSIYLPFYSKFTPHHQLRGFLLENYPPTHAGKHRGFI